MSVYVSVYKSPFGNITMASRGDKIIGLWLDGQKYFLGKLKEETVEKDDLEVFALCRRWLDDYFSGKTRLLTRIFFGRRAANFGKVCGIYF